MTNRPDHDQLYSIAEAQAGYFTAKQARTVGFSPERLSNSTKSGTFTRVGRGVYRLTRFPSSPFEDLFVAWLRTGPRSVISHESALTVYQLTDVMPGQIHVTIPRTSSHRHPGTRLHTNHLESEDVTFREGLPITTPARTIADVAQSGLPEDLIQQAIQESLRRGLVTSKELQDQVDRRQGRTKMVIRRFLG